MVQPLVGEFEIGREEREPGPVLFDVGEPAFVTQSPIDGLGFTEEPFGVVR